MGFKKTIRRRWRSVLGRSAEFELIVNGERLTASEIDEFKRITGIQALAPGRYWLDLDSGNMGPEGQRAPSFNVFRSPPLRHAATADARDTPRG